MGTSPVREMWSIAAMISFISFLPNFARAFNVPCLVPLLTLRYQNNVFKSIHRYKAISDDDLAFTPKFDNQLVYGMEVDDEGQLNTSFKEIKKKSGKDIVNVVESSASQDATASPVTTESQSTSIGAFEYERERAKIKKIPIISRKVPLGIKHAVSASIEPKDLSSIIWEMEKPADLVQNWMAESPARKQGVSPDPFGVVMWPGSILASQQMQKLDVKGKTVLILGAGTGVEAQAAALLGAKKVIATDINRFTIRLLNFGAEKMGLDNVIETTEFDIFSSTPLPKCDVIVAADILYNEQLAHQVARRCREVLQQPKPQPQLIVTDSQKFHGTNFLNLLKDDYPNLRWEEDTLQNVTGSGILIEEDQTYDVKARMLIL